jgi:hypothetical protein
MKEENTMPNIDTSNSVEVFPLFQSFVDSSSEYKMAKIKLIEDQYFNFVKSLV